MKAVLRLILLSCAAGLLLTGCSYYNTFYNIKKEFRAAERQTELATRQQQATQPVQSPRQGVQPPRSGSSAVGAQGYQAVIESCSKLLEFYPKSRWVDDALLIMGISYFRMQEFSRAERKFSELVTIFPNSRHVEEAKVWRAKSLIAQGKFDDAEKALAATEGELTDAQQAAAAYRALATVQAHRGSDEQAIAYYEKCVSLSYDRDEKAT
ncbi:tetratricopeptide repeat protein, partial [bacterium]|nr:tetratricopeptide repeat protein [bacterium]